MAEASDTVYVLINSLSKRSPFGSDLDYRLIRAAMVFVFFIFGYRKRFSCAVHQPQSAALPLMRAFLGFGAQVSSSARRNGCSARPIFLGFWHRELGAVGAVGAIVAILGAVVIIPFFPNAWAAEAGGFPAIYLPVAFLMKDFLFLAASFYLLKQDLTRAALEGGAELSSTAWGASKTETASR
jgi:uncharacterized membrane protein YkgB